MKTVRYIIYVAVAVLLTGCGLFKKYSADSKTPDNLIGEEYAALLDTAQRSFMKLQWREVFRDPKLQALIDTALANNVNLFSAQTRVKEAEAVLKSAKLGYLPSLSLTPSFSVNPNPKMSYTVPLSLDWGVSGFGSITNRLRETKSLAAQAADNEKAVRSRLVADVAVAYAHLQLMDRQLEILESTEEVWTKVLETQEALFANGKAYSTAVDQMKANLLKVRLQRADAIQSAKDMEASLCLLLGKTPSHIDRNPGYAFKMPESVSLGLPAMILENRADVRAAGRSVEAAYYVTNQARAAMFPSINLGGLIGWAGEGGTRFADPGALIYSAVASLVQPIFQQGKLRANLKVSRYRQEEAAKLYTQTVLQAGNEVNKALRECQTSAQKAELYEKQVAVLKSAYDATQELMMNGKASYIEVLVAQSALLEAQQGQAANIYDGAAGVINLYASLGGGVE